MKVLVRVFRKVVEEVEVEMTQEEFDGIHTTSSALTFEEFEAGIDSLYVGPGFKNIIKNEITLVEVESP